MLTATAKVQNSPPPWSPWAARKARARCEADPATVPSSRVAIMPMRGTRNPPRNVAASATQKPNSFVTSAMSELE